MSDKSNIVKDGSSQLKSLGSKKEESSFLKDDVSGLKSLGSKKTNYPTVTGINSELLERIPNLYKDRRYVVRFRTKELTSLCPRTGQPDGATLTIKYIPDEFMVESKSLKLYVVSFRSAGMFMESLTNLIVTHLVACIKPVELIAVTNFNARGGITTDVKIHYVRGKGVQMDINEEMVI